MTAIDVLKTARALIEKRGWTSYSGPFGGIPIQWAIEVQEGISDDVSDDAVSTVSDLVQPVDGTYLGWMALDKWEAVPGRTQAEALALLDQAIERLEEAG
jgi:hypothetical protein